MWQVEIKKAAPKLSRDITLSPRPSSLEGLVILRDVTFDNLIQKFTFNNGSIQYMAPNQQSYPYNQPHEPQLPHHPKKIASNREACTQHIKQITQFKEMVPEPSIHEGLTLSRHLLE